MALDTATKRAFVSGLSTPWPSGALDQAARQHVSGVYPLPVALGAPLDIRYPTGAVTRVDGRTFGNPRVDGATAVTVANDGRTFGDVVDG